MGLSRVLLELRVARTGAALELRTTRLRDSRTYLLCQQASKSGGLKTCSLWQVLSPLLHNFQTEVAIVEQNSQLLNRSGDH